MHRTIFPVAEPVSGIGQIPIEITDTRAKEIAHAYSDGPRRNVVMSQGARWYDISHMTDAEIMKFISAAS